VGKKKEKGREAGEKEEKQTDLKEGEVKKKGGTAFGQSREDKKLCEGTTYMEDGKR